MNHTHESQAAAMARAGELPDGEQLRECINSGQVSAAQVVAHAEAGEPCMPTPAQAIAEMVTRASALSIDARLCAIAQPAREAVPHQEAGELPSLPRPAVHAFADISESFLRADHYTIDQMRAYARAALAAERAEVERLRAEIDAIREDASEWAKYVIEDTAPLALENYIEREMNKRAALTAPGEKHD